MSRRHPQDPARHLISLDDALALDGRETRALHARHVNPALGRVYDALGTSRLDPVSADGAWIVLRDGRRILDFSSAFGVVALGHNHPRIMGAERRCHEAGVPDAIKLIPSRLQSALAYDLAALMPEPLSQVSFAVSGAEAVEAAIKLCRRAGGAARDLIVVSEGAFHGKTLSTLPYTLDGGRFAAVGGLALDEHLVRRVPFGDLDALRSLLEREGPRVSALLIEPILGESIAVPPSGYLSGIGRVCRQFGVRVIADEIKTGLGRTGALLASVADGLQPDVVTLSKALGGGRRALAATVTSPELFQAAYGRLLDGNAHSTTFGGLPGSCAVGIETLNTIVEDDLVMRAEVLGKRLGLGLREIVAQHPSRVGEALGRGLFQGLRLREGLGGLEHRMLMPALVRALVEEHGLLTHFCESAPGVLHLMPPLIVGEDEIDRALEALDAALSPSRIGSLARFVAANARHLGSDSRAAPRSGTR